MTRPTVWHSVEKPNASGELRPIAGATEEQKLLGSATQVMLSMPCRDTVGHKPRAIPAVNRAPGPPSLMVSVRSNPGPAPGPSAPWPTASSGQQGRAPVSRERRRARAQALGSALPQVEHDQAPCPPDPSEGDQGGIPAARPQARPTRARTTTHRERCTTTLRPRLSRLVRDPCACAQTVATHSGASTCFLCHSNLEKAAALPV
jgi:hypothetical protein